MRTNIDIDDDLLARAMQAGPYKTKREAVEAGLKLLARQAAYKEILKWRGKLKWEGDESIDWTKPPSETPASPGEDRVSLLAVQEPPPPLRGAAVAAASGPAAAPPGNTSARGSEHHAGG
jgi:Arc/MetJ family transcription regulator